jgi:uncharacterized membrane protein YdfJ with MMPL/SSD domain
MTPLPWRKVEVMGWNQWQNNVARRSSAQAIIAFAILSGLALQQGH